MGMPYFIEIFMIAVWEIWNLRNAKIFEGQAMSFQLHKVSEDLKPLVVQWLNTIL